MIKKSPIILLDEATSSLDAETESKIQDALKILTKDRTTIVIAHRLSTILNSDQIYIIDAGNVVAKGKHDELLDNSELYKISTRSRFEKDNVFLYQILIIILLIFSPLIIFFRILKKRR